MNEVFCFKEGLISQKRKWKQKAKDLKKENAALRLQILNQNAFASSAQKVKFHIAKMVEILPELDETNKKVTLE